MKVKVLTDPNLTETEVTITCSKVDQNIKDLEKTLMQFNQTIEGRKDQKLYALLPSDIYYFDALDNRVFAYTKDDLFDVNLKLYQIEETMSSLFIRINKNTIVNPRKIKSFKSSINGRMETELINGDRLMISRMYVPKIKEMLGGDKR